MALICNDQPAMIRVLDHYQHDVNPASAMRLARMHGKHHVAREELLRSDRWHEAVRAVESYTDEGTLDFNF
jgi:beta-N-acetylhexosaminidase